MQMTINGRKETMVNDRNRAPASSRCSGWPDSGPRYRGGPHPPHLSDILQGETILMLAVRQKQLSIVQFLVENDANLFVKERFVRANCGGGGRRASGVLMMLISFSPLL